MNKKQKITKFIIKDVRNRFRLKTEANENTIKDIRCLFRPKKKKKINKKRKRGLFLFEQEKEYFCKQVRTDYFWTRNFIEHESYGDRKKNYQLKNTLIKSIFKRYHK